MTERGEEILRKTPHLVCQELSYEESVKTLAMADVERKRLMVHFFKKDKVSSKIFLAAKLEMINRSILEKIVFLLPRMPIVVYKVISKLVPNWRDIILR